MARPGLKHELIKEQALRLLVERGVDAVSMRDIAEACNMQKANFYNYYPSQDALVSELFHEGYAAYAALLHPHAVWNAPFRLRLEAMINTICCMHDEDHLRFRFLIMTQHRHLRDVARDEHNPVELIHRSLARAMQDGEIPARDPALMTAVIIGILVQPATFILYGRLQGGLQERAIDLVNLCWRALS